MAVISLLKDGSVPYTIVQHPILLLPYLVVLVLILLFRLTNVRCCRNTFVHVCACLSSSNMLNKQLLKFGLMPAPAAMVAFEV